MREMMSGKNSGRGLGRRPAALSGAGGFSGREVGNALWSFEKRGIIMC